MLAGIGSFAELVDSLDPRPRTGVHTVPMYRRGARLAQVGAADTAAAAAAASRRVPGDRALGSSPAAAKVLLLLLAPGHLRVDALRGEAARVAAILPGPLRAGGVTLQAAGVCPHGPGCQQKR